MSGDSGPDEVECAKQAQGNEERPRPCRDQSKDLPSSSSTTTSMDENSNSEMEHEENPEPDPDQPEDFPSRSGSAMHTNENEQMVIASTKQTYLQIAKIANDKSGIRATDVALGLRRIPAGFYTVVHHSGLEWPTEIKRPSVNDDVIEWGGPIPM